MSVIIVNYNVKHFVQHCVNSVLAACANLEVEVFVVDNASSDDSITHFNNVFSDNRIRVIASPTNLGFAKGNNLALQHCTGKYVLFLNPDTLVPEDCFSRCIDKLQADNSIGALGVRLIDGSGTYLPESKRGFPDFATAFYRIVGLNKLFPNSAKFSRYYLGNISQGQNSYVDVLVGCFMMMPTDLVKELGGFDEDYFMYGEDIDLSYKVQKSGRKNFYFAELTVIHFKGESTKKDSMKYVRMFYNAMIVFAKKHLNTSGATSYIQLIKLAIVARASLDIIVRALGKVFLPMCDALLMLFALWITKSVWLAYIKTNTVYPQNMVSSFFASYIVIWLLSIFLSGGYDTPLRKVNILRGMAIGAVITLAIYGLLPEQVRFSRGITASGAVASALLIWLLRFMFQYFGMSKVAPVNGKQLRILTVAQQQQSETSISIILKGIGIHSDIVGNVSPTSQIRNSDLGSIDNINDIGTAHDIREIIFAYPDVSYKQLIDFMQKHPSRFSYKMFANGIGSIIGSNSKNTAGNYYASEEHFSIAQPYAQRAKRTFDIISSIVLIVVSPVLYWFTQSALIYKNVISVLLGKQTWVGYEAESLVPNLPPLRAQVFSCGAQYTLSETSKHTLNLNYARNYHWRTDFNVLVKKLFR